ncbi:MAG: feoB [Firmicutes bacterium]|nr:feoB [Bacillota bacterium]
MSYTFALVGNPNCGKTTMFNEITGSTQYVGNWPGVTVEKKVGKAKKQKEDIKIVDLPGIYSLSPYSLEEVISRDYIIDEKPDVIINIVDASNIERNLYLTLQLKELGVPMVVALNMMDVVEAKGTTIDLEALQRDLNVAIVPTSASKGKGISNVINIALERAQVAFTGTESVETGIFDKHITKALLEIEDSIAEIAKRHNYNPKWLALKLMEEDSKVIEKLQISPDILATVKLYSKEIEQKYDNDVETVIADQRYTYISQVVARAIRHKNVDRELSISDKIDKIVTNRLLAIPLFLAIMYIIFYISFGSIGSYTIDWVDGLINGTIAEALSTLLVNAGAADWLHALVIDGVLAGMGGMLVFVPQIMLMFLFLSILEDSGYMARAAFIMDRLLRRLGLTGKSFIPMLMGFGCSVPAVMSTRALENEKDRRLTILLTPFMSCGARLPIYAVFAGAFFAANQTLVVFSMYVLGVLVAIVSGVILKKTILKGEAAPFVMELPPYRIPTLKGLGIHMWDRGKGFIKKAGTVIFAASVVIWFGQSFDFSLNMVEDMESSILGVIGTAIAPFFAPLGFGDAKSSVALLTGLVAKEVVVSTLSILHGLGDSAEGSAALFSALQAYFTPLTAYAYMAFTLLYVPCVAALGSMKKELNSWKWTLFAIVFQTGVAWIIAFVIYQGGKLLGLG